MLNFLNQSLNYLASKQALESIHRDPYWPKWDSPWWHMLLLHELDLAEEIPKNTVKAMVEKLKSHYLPIFPVKEEDLPPGTDPVTEVACHCALGTIYQVLFSAGVDVDTELPWLRPWFLRYQLPDGGLNCDERAYTKPVQKSSLVSTLPCLEALLYCQKNNLSPEEKKFLDRGAKYLLRHQLWKKESNGETIDQDWLEIRFPRFYDYDFLRGFYFLFKYRQISGLAIPDSLTDEVEKLVASQMDHEEIKLKRYNLFDKRSYNFSLKNSWEWGPASEFALMKEVSSDKIHCPVLSKLWEEVRPRRAKVTCAYEVAYKNPIKLHPGESVKIEKRETNPAWPGWVFCRDSKGTGGWVHEKYLDEDEQESATVINDYDATELSAGLGEELHAYYQDSGWWWCRTVKGERGWVPNQNLQF